MAEPARKYETDNEVDAALAALGLTREILNTALLFSEAERRSCTKDDPGILKGALGWGRLIRSLREQLRPLKWRREEPNSLPLVVSPDRKFAITVATGNDDTGNPRASFAATKFPKGDMLRRWTEPWHQPSLEDDPDQEPETRPELWILLVHRTSLWIIAELSRPTSVTPDERLRFGGDRIFLKPLPVDQTLAYEDDEGDDEEPPEVHVERRR